MAKEARTNIQHGWSRCKDRPRMTSVYFVNLGLPVLVLIVEPYGGTIVTAVCSCFFTYSINIWYILLDRTREGILLGYGNALLDIVVNGTEEFLQKYELEPDGAILAEEKHKPLFEDMIKTFPDSVNHVPGGATQNSIRVAQWLIQVPNATTFFGCINKDENGKILEEKLKNVGVNVRYQKTDKDATGTSACIVTGTSRSLCGNLAAAKLFTADHLDIPENWELVEKAQYFYVAEADTFAEENNFGTTDRKEIAEKIANMEYKKEGSKRTVVITQANLPTIVAKDGKVMEFPVNPIKPDDIVDTTGAGDAFVGGFLAQLVQGRSLEECIKCANYAANLIIQRSGCSFPEKPSF